MNTLTTILMFAAILLVILAANALCKKYIFTKIRVNKWIPLGIAIVFFVIQMFVGNSNLYISSALSIFTVLFFLWFMDIIQTGGPRKKEKQIAIRPKAKPNRVKKNK
ncbi:hypothetical protein [Clostridium saccharoperbutylacetonicum]